jgi:hypothetical protein
MTQQPEHVRKGVAKRAERHADVAAQQDKIALQLIEKAARNGHSCPSNERLASAMGFASSGAPAAVLKRLQHRGLIEIGRNGNDRVIRIVASGLQTAGEMLAPARRGSAAPRKRMTRKDRFAEALAECGDVNFAGYMIGVAHDTARRLFDEICADLGSQAQ